MIDLCFHHKSISIKTCLYDAIDFQLINRNLLIIPIVVVVTMDHASSWKMTYVYTYEYYIEIFVCYCVVATPLPTRFQWWWLSTLYMHTGLNVWRYSLLFFGDIFKNSTQKCVLHSPSLRRRRVSCRRWNRFPGRRRFVVTPSNNTPHQRIYVQRCTHIYIHIKNIYTQNRGFSTS